MLRSDTLAKLAQTAYVAEDLCRAVGDAAATLDDDLPARFEMHTLLRAFSALKHIEEYAPTVPRRLDGEDLILHASQWESSND